MNILYGVQNRAGKKIVTSVHYGTDHPPIGYTSFSLSREVQDWQTRPGETTISRTGVVIRDQDVNGALRDAINCGAHEVWVHDTGTNSRIDNTNATWEPVRLAPGSGPADSQRLTGGAAVVVDGAVGVNGLLPTGAKLGAWNLNGYTGPRPPDVHAG